MLTRKYETKEDCARLWIGQDFMNVDSDWFTTNPDVEINYYGLMDGEDGYNEDDVEFEQFGMTHQPMWNTWFMPTEFMDIDWIKNNQEEIALLGFTIIEIIHDRFEEVALGIDGAGYSFYENHFVPLYELRGFQWHEED